MFGTNGGSAIELRSLRVYVALEDSELAKRYEPNMFQWKKGELENIRAGDPGNEEARDTGASGDAGASSDASSSGGGFKFPWQR